ncbi:MAG: hypothetical protein KF805_15335 [Phycisphaeraceae bacterium]|nr:hypothetical protein [Phycisphaeraceae bacterium]
MDSGEIHILGGWDAAGPVAGATDSAVLACVEHLLRRSSLADRVVLVAGEHGERRAASLGLGTPIVVPPAVLRGRFLRDGLARVLARFERPSRLVCWNDSLRNRVRPPTAWRTKVKVEHPGDTAARRLPAGDRISIRASLDLPLDEHVLILAADPPDALSAQDFIRACALVALVGRNVTAIVPRQAPEMERAKATLRTTGIPIRLLTCEAPVWTLLPCADAAVLDVLEGSVPRGTPVHSQRWMATTCAQLGIPVVWPEAESLGSERLDRWLLRPRSRLAVNVARVLNEHLLASGGELLDPVGAMSEAVA